MNTKTQRLGLACFLGGFLLVGTAAAADPFTFRGIEIVESEADTLALAEPAAGAEKPAAAPAEAAPAADEARVGFMGLVKDNFYQGGRGLITNQGMSGMFLNPTSGTLRQGQFTAQWCVLLSDQRNGLPDLFGNGVMASYGVTDWAEVGGFMVNVTIEDGFTDPNATTAGPFFRIRVLKDEDWMPEISVGAIWLDGNANSDVLSREEIFIAASKHFPIDPDGIVKGVRVHGGVRFIWNTERPVGGEANGVVPYVGVEVGLPYSIYFISEVSTKDDILSPPGFKTHVPYSFGFQWRPNNVVGVSFAGIQPSFSDRLAMWIGLGLNFEF
jgi:hypothetical protein